MFFLCLLSVVGEEDGDEEEVEEEETIEEETDITENDSLGRAIVDKASTVGESGPRTSKKGKVVYAVLSCYIGHLH